MNDAIADKIVVRLSTHIGPNVARMAVRSFAKKAGIPDPAQLAPAHVSALMDDLRPMLHVMMGRGPAEALVADILREVG